MTGGTCGSHPDTLCYPSESALPVYVSSSALQEAATDQLVYPRPSEGYPSISRSRRSKASGEAGSVSGRLGPRLTRKHQAGNGTRRDKRYPLTHLPTPQLGLSEVGRSQRFKSGKGDDARTGTIQALDANQTQVFAAQGKNNVLVTALALST